MRFSLVLLCAASLLGCASSATADGMVSDVGGYPIFDESEAYRIARTQEIERSERIGECLRLEGWEYTVAGPTQVLLDDAHAVMSGDVALDDADYAARYGFGLTTLQPFDFDIVDPDDPRIEELTPERTEQEKYELSLSEVELSAYDKSYNDCIDSVDSELGPSAVRSYLDSYDDVANAKLQFTLDLEVVDFYSEWSECMLERDFSYTSPLEAYLQLSSEADEVIVSENLDVLYEFQAKEIDVAKATTACGGPVVSFVPIGLEDVWERYSSGL